MSHHLDTPLNSLEILHLISSLSPWTMWNQLFHIAKCHIPTSKPNTETRSLDQRHSKRIFHVPINAKQKLINTPASSYMYVYIYITSEQVVSLFPFGAALCCLLLAHGSELVPYKAPPSPTFIAPEVVPSGLNWPCAVLNPQNDGF